MMFAGVACTVGIQFTAAVNAQPLHTPFPWVIPATDVRTTADFPAMPEAPAGKHGMLLAASPDGHFHFADGTRIRFWGTTLMQSAVFPDSADAITQAAHLQKFGFNIVRLYGFDAYWNSGEPTYSIFTSYSTDSTTQNFDSVQLHRLDWFIYQLKTHGIYVDIVMNSYRGFRYGDHVDHSDSIPWACRIVKYYEPRVQELERQFAEMLFTHVNEFTGLAYKDEPAIALVELTDQDPMMTWVWNDYVFRTSSATILSAYQTRQLDTLFNRFLLNKYGTTQKLSAAWNAPAVPSANRIQNGSFEQFNRNWSFAAGEGNSADAVIIGSNAPDSSNFMRVVITSVDKTTYGIYLANATCNVVADSLHTFSFYAKTTNVAGRKIVVASDFGLYLSQTIDTAWKQYSVVFRPPPGASGVGSQVAFYLSSEMGDVMLDGVKLVRTQEIGLTTGERLESASVARARSATFPVITNARMRDVSLFYDSLTNSYFTGMRNFLHNLGVRVPLAGINLPGVLGDARTEEPMDFVAAGVQWDYYATYSNDSTWTLNNKAIVNNRWGPLTRAMLTARYHKPLVVTSYTHLFPNAYQTESMLHAPGYAALQDYDGIIWTNYMSDNSQLHTRQITKSDLYELAHNPAMMSMMPAAAAMFRNGSIAASTKTIRIQHDTNDVLLSPKYQAARGGGFGIVGSINPGAMFVRGMRIDSLHARTQHTTLEYDQSGADSTYVESDTRELKWDAGALGVLSIDAPCAQGATGFLHNSAQVVTGMCAATRQDTGNFGSYLWVSLDTTRLDSASKSLLVLSARGGNSNMKWNAAGTSIGNQWGTAPTVLEPMKIAFNFRTAADTMILYPLDTLGRRTFPAIGAARNFRGEWRVVLDQSIVKTPWFVIEQTFRDTSASTGIAATPVAPLAGLCNYPEPFRSHTTLYRSDVDRSTGALRVYDALGRLVLDLTNAAGETSAIDIDASRWPSGAYRCVSTNHGRTSTHTMVHVP